MPAYVTEFIVWACAIAFVACLIGALLILFERWIPKNPATRKWLVSGVLVSAVTGVGGYASQQFKDADATPATPEIRKGKDEVEERPHQPLARKNPPRRADEQPGEEEPVPTEPVRLIAKVPEEVAAWAEAELGTRPVFDISASYPDCVATLRSQDTVSRKEARSCRAGLEQLHLTAIIGFYNLKRPYDANLEDQEAALREGGISQDELARYNYVTAEMDRLNGDKSEELPAVHKLETRLLEDIQSCRKSLCQAPD